MDSEQNKEKPFLNLDIIIFDDDWKCIKRQNQKINESKFLAINNNREINIYNNQSEIDVESKDEILFQIKKKFDTYKLVCPLLKNNKFQKEKDVEKYDKKLWCRLNKEKEENIQNEFFLYENDIIKIGNMRFIVYETKINSEDNDIYYKEQNDDNKYENVNINSGAIFEKIPKIRYKKCNFCDTDNVMCISSVKNYNIDKFFKCMKKSIENKIKIKKTKTITIYSVDDFYCKKCNTPYPFCFGINEIFTYDIFDIKKPDNNYIILESLNHKNDKGGFKKSVYVIKLSDKSIIIGRDKNNEIVIDDSSEIEKLEKYAEIKFNKESQKIVLTNLDKNKETSILIKNHLNINEKKIRLSINKIHMVANIIHEDI